MAVLLYAVPEVMLVHTCNPGIWEAAPEALQIQSQTAQ